MRHLIAAALVACAIAASASDEVPRPLRGIKRIVFLGDSITYAGTYIELLDAILATQYPKHSFELINLGLPSETVSGLSEAGHAGGAFPRPDLHERLDRALAKTKPDMVVACYGMNDGIYFPLAEERFAKYRAGMERLAEKVKKSGAKLLILTPPVFDPEPIRANTLPAGLDAYPKPYVGYDEVLTRYSKWLLDQRRRGWWVEDVHGPMLHHLEAVRKQQGRSYRLADDGVHANATGHRIMADAMLRAWKVKNGTASDEIYKLVQERQRIMKDAWLTEVGHARPGMAKGLPIAEAREKSAEIDARIHVLAGKGSGG
jgi:lysophospholipase L1-like esterase